MPVKGVLAVDAEGDIALLKIDPPTPQVRPLPLDKTSPQEGESVVVIGNPLGLEGSVTNGIVSAVRDIPTFGRIIQITAPISSGSSGSPVVNMQGQVIGIATLQVTGGQSVNFAIPSERISQLQATTIMSLPDLVGKDFEEAREELRRRGLGVQLVFGREGNDRSVASTVTLAFGMPALSVTIAAYRLR